MWSVAWAPLGVVLSTIVWVDMQLRWTHGAGTRFPPIVEPMIMCAAWGFVNGALFAAMLAVAERRRGTLDGLSMRRTALWGALGGLALPIFGAASLSLTLPFMLASTALSLAFGAASAAGTLALARRAPEGGIPPAPNGLHVASTRPRDMDVSRSDRDAPAADRAARGSGEDAAHG
jgi:hypothetical protein